MVSGLNDTATHEVAAQSANLQQDWCGTSLRCPVLRVHCHHCSALTVVAYVNETLKFAADALRSNLLQKPATHKRIHADSTFLLASD